MCSLSNRVDAENGVLGKLILTAESSLIVIRKISLMAVYGLEWKYPQTVPSPL